MKNILVFSDLHANKYALRDIIPILENYDITIFCGDILGYGKDIDYCIDFILNNIDLVVLGNHDRLAITDENLDKQPPVVKDSILYTRAKLSAVLKEKIIDLPLEIWYDNLYVTHSINDDYLRDENDFNKLFQRGNKHTEFFFFGHTHEQVLYKRDNKILINPGSVTKGRKGYPRSYVTLNEEDINFINLEDIF